MSLRSEFIAWYFNEFNSDMLYVAMNGLSEESPWHREGSIGIHTNMVVTEYLTRIDSETDFLSHRLGLFAAAFHDVGKPGACEFKWKEERGDYKSFSGHELLSARLWEDWATRNWTMLRDRFKFVATDIYRVAWLIEHHRPWDTKNPHKVNNMVLTAINAVGYPVFTRLLQADTWGRLSDDAAAKREKASAWIGEFIDKCKNVLPNEGLVLDEWSGALDLNQPCLFVPIGASGCGKSTIYKQLSSEETIKHYSWDALRLEWYSSDYNKAFELSCDDKHFLSKVNSEFSRLVKSGNSIYVDNTNTSAKRRRFFVDQARRAGYRCVAILMPLALQTVIDRQHTREDKSVPANAVERQYLNTQMPQFGEFDEIMVRTL